MNVPFVLVDVFAEEPFAGNQLCVVPRVPQDLSDDAMLAIAREVGFSETTFVTDVRPDGYDVRIFTPTGEIPFAGHPTLGTAYVLASEGLVSHAPVQTSPAGDVAVTIDLASGRGWMRQLPPVFAEEFPGRHQVARAAGLEITHLVDSLPIVPVSTGIFHLMVPVREEAALRHAVRDDRRTEAVCESASADSLYLFTVRRDGDVMARMFDRSWQIGEDPATGSAAGPLGAYLAAFGCAGMPGRLVVAQGELTGRPSVLNVDVASAGGDGWTVDVGGGVHRMGSGVFELDGRR